MWLTSTGERVLQGPERLAFVAGVQSIYSALYAADFDSAMLALCAEWPQIFDDLTGEQKLVAIAEVAKGLLDPKRPSVPICAWRAATVAAVFAALSEEIRLELEYEATGEDVDDYFRKSLLLMSRKLRKDDPDIADCCPKNLSNTDMSDWQFVIDACVERINHDADFDMVELQDLNPETRRAVNSVAGITSSYYTEPAPLDSAANVKAAKKYLNKL